MSRGTRIVLVSETQKCSARELGPLAEPTRGMTEDGAFPENPKGAKLAWPGGVSAEWWHSPSYWEKELSHVRHD